MPKKKFVSRTKAAKPDRKCPACGSPLRSQEAKNRRIDYFCLACPPELLGCLWCGRFMQRKLVKDGNGWYYHCYHRALDEKGEPIYARDRSRRKRAAFSSTTARAYSYVTGWKSGQAKVSTKLTITYNAPDQKKGFKPITIINPNSRVQERYKELVAQRHNIGLDLNGEGTPNAKYQRVCRELAECYEIKDPGKLPTVKPELEKEYPKRLAAWLAYQEF